MPVLTKDGKVYSHFVAIARLLGKELGYLPEDTDGAFVQDEAIESFKDIMIEVFKLVELKEDK